MKKLVAVLLALLCLVSAAPAFAADTADDTIVYSFMSNVGPLNPHLYFPNQAFAQEMVYEGLVEAGEDGAIRPALAESWELSADGRTYRFNLRPGVVFSDGRAFNADAVVMNFAAIMANAGEHEWLPLTSKIKSFRAEGELLFVLELKSAYYAALEELALPRPFRFLSPAAFIEGGLTRAGIKKPVGTGPWKLARSVPGEYDLFERNELYWRDKAKCAMVLVKVIPDAAARAEALKKGEIDLVYGAGQIPYAAFKALRENPAYSCSVSKPAGGMVVAVNSAKGPTRELSVRRALQYATDKNALIAGAFCGIPARADTLFAPGAPYCDAGITAYEYNPKRAAALLDEFGWELPKGKKTRERNGHKLELDFCFVAGDADQQAVGEALQGQLARVGISLNLVGEEEGRFLKRQQDGDFSLIVNRAWGAPFEPHTALGAMLRPVHADYMAQSGLSMKPDLDRKITRALESGDAEERRSLYRHILKSLHEQAVYLPVFYQPRLEAHKKDALDGVRFAPGGTRIPFERFVKK